MDVDNMQLQFESLLCPITHDIFKEPVIDQNNHTFERKAIEDWIQRSGTCPIGREPLTIDELRPNIVVKSIVEEFEKFTINNRYEFTLGNEVEKRNGQPLMSAFGKKIYRADWKENNCKRPPIVLLEITGARAKKEASFYVELSRHPHIVRTFGLVLDLNSSNKNKVLLLQEYAQLGNLQDILSSQKKDEDVSEKVLAQIFIQIADGMVYLTEQNIIHGDLACRNILVFRFDKNEPEQNIVKITDFGLSQHSELYKVTPDAAITTTSIIPTRYAAPELLKSPLNKSNRTEKSDVFSMAVLMWEAYNKCVAPWENVGNDDDVANKVKAGERLPRSHNCTDRYWSLITKMWSESPDDRPNFKQIRKLLNEYYYTTGKNYIYLIAYNDLYVRISIKRHHHGF